MTIDLCSDDSESSEDEPMLITGELASVSPNLAASTEELCQTRQFSDLSVAPAPHVIARWVFYGVNRSEQAVGCASAASVINSWTLEQYMQVCAPFSTSLFETQSWLVGQQVDKVSLNMATSIWTRWSVDHTNLSDREVCNFRALCC